MKKRKLSAKQKKYFAPRKKTKRVVNIAKRSRSRVYYSKAKRFYGKRKGLLGGSMGNIVIGAVAGAVSPMIPQFLGTWTNPLAFGVAGYVFKKPGLLTIAGYEAGKSLISGGLGGIFGGTNQGGLL